MLVDVWSNVVASAWALTVKQMGFAGHAHNRVPTYISGRLWYKFGHFQKLKQDQQRVFFLHEIPGILRFFRQNMESRWLTCVLLSP